MEPATAVGSSATDPREEHFHPSRRNPLRTLRVTLWASCTVGLVIGALAARGQPTHLLVLAGALLLFLLPADWLIRRQIRDGRRLITITRDAIASAAFSGKEKRLLWSEIESVTVETVQSAPYLAFRLKAGSGTAGRRRFLAWRNRSKRILALSSFDTADRERLLDSIQIHLRLHGGSVGAQSMPVNPFKAERQFEEKLEALAPQPRFTYALIVLNVLAWLVTLMLGGNPLQTPISVLFNLGGNAAFEVQHGEWWRLLSATFLHAGVLHLAINMAGLYATGIAVERIYGPAAYLLIYLGAGLLGSALSLSFAAQHAIGVGASGAVFGVAGAWLVAIGRYRGLMPQTLSKRLLTQLGLFVLYSLGQGLTKPGVDNAAHIGGLVGGCMLAMILPARLDMDRYRQLLPGRAAMALAAAGAGIAVLAMLAPKAMLDHRQFFASAEAAERGFNAFGAAADAMQADQQAFAAGRLSARQWVERSHAIHAPALRRAADMLRAVKLAQGDPRAALQHDITRYADLTVEAMELTVMETPESLEPVSTDPARLERIQRQRDAARKQLQMDADALRHRPFS
ncbi:rhomboid family intramembrane serine protease [Ralstonia solanacearum K60]|uniref:Rhomboid family intramembrane serine protease n=1 Tax=Ralstonia solanacearum K60 TaxID=1091042 RepID=A0AAP8D2E3_RALSL|nr:rhomboid family intramembrane serine protease [Ralstonia solanacearum K60]RIJ83943.1 rhomboid family intramembrane serine protease [Ralstonia solanacearum]